MLLSKLENYVKEQRALGNRVALWCGLGSDNLKVATDYCGEYLTIFDYDENGCAYKVEWSQEEIDAWNEKQGLTKADADQVLNGAMIIARLKSERVQSDNAFKEVLEKIQRFQDEEKRIDEELSKDKPSKYFWQNFTSPRKEELFEEIQEIIEYQGVV
tara:strand:- start:213 stop:686 length:474 start_codon:yes stop_codon:yes gene_type:complete